MSGWLVLLWGLATASSAMGASPGACERVRLRDLAAEPGPGVLVLGSRHGVRRDLNRARRLVKKLSKSGPVTLALEPVAKRKQDVLERLELGRMPFDRLAQALSWEQYFGFDYDRYEPLLALYEQEGVRVRAAGVPVELPPDDATVALPPGYASVLADTMGDGPVPPALESTFVQTVAWHDRRVAEAAVEVWNGRGWLVVVVDRTWVQGGLGVQWQARRLTEAPVSAVLLADAGGRCYRGDRVIR